MAKEPKREHRDAYNAKRRKQYADDPKARLKALIRSRRYREQLRAGHTPDPSEQYREINAELHRVYALPEAARSIGISPQTIRNWENRALIPEAMREGRRRVYTQQQIDLLKVFAKVPNDNRKERLIAADYVFDNWE